MFSAVGLSRTSFRLRWSARASTSSPTTSLIVPKSAIIPVLGSTSPSTVTKNL